MGQMGPLLSVGQPRRVNMAALKGGSMRIRYSAAETGQNNIAQSQLI